MLHYKLQPVSLLKVKTELKKQICNRIYGISCKGPVSIKQVLKNADIRILSNFLAIFSDFFSISRNFTKYYLHAKFQINWTIQTEITEGGADSAPPLPPCNTNLQIAQPV